MWHTLVAEVLKNSKKSLNSILLYIILLYILYYILLYLYILYILYISKNFFLTLGTHIYTDYEI